MTPEWEDREDYIEYLEKTVDETVDFLILLTKNFPKFPQEVMYAWRALEQTLVPFDKRR